MLTDKDIKKLQAVFPSRKDYKNAFKTVDKRFDAVDKRFDRIETVVIGTQQRVNALETRMDRVEKLLEGLIVGIDRLTTSVDNLLLEYAAIKDQLNRHERWIRQIAQKAGVALAD